MWEVVERRLADSVDARVRGSQLSIDDDASSLLHALD